MAFTLSTNLPVDFLGCKALTIELFSLLREAVPGSPEYMSAQFDLRVMRYRLAKHHCKKSWDAETVIFLKSFEFAFPHLAIDVPEGSLRHMTCGCSENATIDHHKEALAACRHLLEVAKPANVVQYDINDYVAEQENVVAIPSVSQSEPSVSQKLEEDETESVTQELEEDEADPIEDFDRDDFDDEEQDASYEEEDKSRDEEDVSDLQFGDVIIAEFDVTPGPWSVPTDRDQKNLLWSINDRDRRQKITTNVVNDTIAAIMAEEEIVRGSPYPSGHIVSEIVISSIDRGLQYEVRSTSHDAILAYKRKPNAEELFNDVVNLGLTNIQAWKAYLLWSKFIGRPQSDSIDLSLSCLALINTPMDGVERFLL